MDRPRRLLPALVVAALVLASPWALAADDDVHVRIVQIKASGKRVEGTKAVLDKDLEPLRAHLDQSGLTHARYQLIGKTVRGGRLGKPVAFDLEGARRAQVTATPCEGGRLQVVFEVTRRDAPSGKDELVFRTTLQLKDGATAVQALAKALDGGDLVLALTASRDPL